MFKSLAVGAALLASAAFAAPASAAPALPQSAPLNAAADAGELLVKAHWRHRHYRRHHHHHFHGACRRVCVGHLHFSRRHGHWHCHGYWANRCW